MPALKDKLENALNEDRILMLGIQVLIGFDYRAVFEDKFTQLLPVMQYLKIVSLSLLIAALALMLAPLTFHWIRGRGENHRELHGYTQRMIEWGLLPFGIAMAIDMVVASSRVFSPTISYIAGAVVLALAGGFWYGLEYYRRQKNPMKKGPQNMDQPIELKDRIKQVLTETRIALPGVQATLGFQFIIVLASGFDSLPGSLRILHIASLLCSAICAIFLIAPAAYHRIVLSGEDSEYFVQFASRMLLIALVPLALALSGDVTVVVWKVTHSMPLAIGWAVATLMVTLGFWFVYMAWRRESGGLEVAPQRIQARLDHFERSGE
jgi:hypothetical protein